MTTTSDDIVVDGIPITTVDATEEPVKTAVDLDDDIVDANLSDALKATKPATEEDEQPATAENKRKVIGKVAIASVGFMLDAYDFFIINIVLHIMSEVYDAPTDAQKGFVASMALWGALTGQIVFGVLADKLGRRVIFVTTCILVIVGSLGSAVVYDSPNFSIYWSMGICRFFLGLGVGGEYPLSASVANEASESKSKGKLTVVVFSMQGWGALLAPSVSSLILFSGCDEESTWRICLGVAVIPMLIILPFRWRMEESHTFTKAKAESVAAKARKNEIRAQSAEEISRARRRCRSCLKTVNKYKYMMMGTAVSWFLLDVCFYANSLFNADVTAALGFGDTALESSVASVAITAISLPGYFLSIFLMDKIGRKILQAGGFVVVGILFAVMATQYDWLLTQPGLFLFLYGLTFLFSNFGPNATTYVIAAEIYPSIVKATCHGLSAATGKLGAALGAYMFPPIQSQGRTLINTTEYQWVDNSTTLMSVQEYDYTSGLKTVMFICSVRYSLSFKNTWCVSGQRLMSPFVDDAMLI